MCVIFCHVPWYRLDILTLRCFLSSSLVESPATEDKILVIVDFLRLSSKTLFSRMLPVKSLFTKILSFLYAGNRSDYWEGLFLANYFWQISCMRSLVSLYVKKTQKDKIGWHGKEKNRFYSLKANTESIRI